MLRSFDESMALREAGRFGAASGRRRRRLHRLRGGGEPARHGRGRRAGRTATVAAGVGARRADRRAGRPAAPRRGCRRALRRRGVRGHGEPTGSRRWSSATAPNSTRTSSSSASDRARHRMARRQRHRGGQRRRLRRPAAAPAHRTCGRSETSHPGSTALDTKCALNIGATSPTRPESWCAAMLGKDLPATVTVPYFWSDQYDVKIQCLGEPRGRRHRPRRRGRRPQVPRVSTSATAWWQAWSAAACPARS